MDEEFRERRFARLLFFIEHMPRPSLYLEARAVDPELGEALLDALERDPNLASSHAERFSEWGLLHYMVTDLCDAVDKNTAATIAVATGEYSAPSPRPRPKSAVEIQRERRYIQRSRALMDKFRPRE